MCLTLPHCLFLKALPGVYILLSLSCPVRFVSFVSLYVVYPLICSLPCSTFVSFSLVIRRLPSLPPRLFPLAAACNDLVASGRDRKPSALIQVAVIDPHELNLVTQTCTEVVEVRHHTASCGCDPLTFGVCLCAHLTGDVVNDVVMAAVLISNLLSLTLS